ncbi:MAG: SurA N-terminal domain-containing protein [Pseudomonadaceae bacterium]|nr:SurA N-terminal domain-containing protein [Pseudomonadaceae bacterium]
MLQVFRNFGASRGWGALMLVLVAAFALWGIGDYVMHTTSGAALTINGKDVPLREVDATYRNRVGTITQMLGGTPPTPEMLEQLDVPQMVLTEVIHRNLLQQAAHSLRLAPARTQLEDTITAMDAFKENGAFSPARYKQVLAQQNLSPAAFEKMLADELAMQQFAKLVEVATPPAAPLKPLLELAEASYTLETFTLPPASAVVATTPPADAELQAFYDANQSAYAVPEKRSFTTVILDTANIGRTLTISEDEVKARYEEAQESYSEPEQRHVRHILVADAKRAVELYNRLKAGADFGQTAAANSIDPASKAKGGDLGMIADDDVVADFAKVAFATPAGEVAEPVQTPFGWHIIKVESIQPARALPLAEVRGRIEETLKQEHALTAMEDLLRTIDDKAAGGSTLAEIAAATGLKPQTHARVAHTTNTLDAALLDAAFNTDKGRVEGPVTLEGGALAYVEVTDIAPQSVPPLAEIKERLLADYQRARVQTALNKQAAQLAATAVTGGNVGISLANVAQGMKLRGGQAATLELANVTDAPTWLHGALNKVYALPAGGVLAEPLRDGESWVVVRLVKRNLPALDAAAAKAAAVGYQQQLQQDVEALLIGEMVRQASIRYNPPALRQVFGVTWNPPQ